MAQTCISLKGSKACPAFNESSISTDDALVGLFPFLSDVTNTASFDSGLQSYIDGSFAQIKYQQLLGCSKFDSAADTTNFYARYTTTVLCNAIIQNSIQPCSLGGSAAAPLCADSCAAYAENEEQITASSICGKAGDDALTQIRADFVNCALPANSLTGSCIEAVANQPDDCGFTTNLAGLCSYCSASSPNATDSCCVFSDTTTRCAGVKLPVVASSALKPITVTGTSMGASGTAAMAGTGGVSHNGLTHGQIAGIVVGSILGALLLLGLIVGACLLMRRRREHSPATSIFNQPAQSRHGAAYHDGARDQERGMSMTGGGVVRMSALEGSSSDERNAGRYGAGGFRKSTSEEEDTPDSRLAPPPKRSGSLSSGSRLAMIGGAGQQDTSPSTNGEDYTSPESQGQSEQLGFFKDYYSQDEIHPGDLVATLWAYEPRAADEFHLERGDMVKVLGIWDDGWATGVRVRQRADDWRPDDRIQRDSGMSSGSQKPPDTADGGEVKAFPLVCVCLPQHWRKTIEGESTGETQAPDIP